jgi:hypothetical protein
MWAESFQPPPPPRNKTKLLSFVVLIRVFCVEVLLLTIHIYANNVPLGFGLKQLFLRKI